MPDPLAIPEKALPVVVEVLKRLESDKLSFYKPFPYQTKLHGARDANGELATEVCFMAGNRTGKTFGGVHDAAFHLTGRYPDDWPGVRYPRPINAWAGGTTNENTRDILQAGLFGDPRDPNAFGTGSIPKETIVSKALRQGIRDAIDTVIIRHVSGKNSRVQFKSYEMGKEAWMGQGQDYCLLDEEPPQDIYSQCLRAVSLSPWPRIVLTFTPEKGMSEVVKTFYFTIGPRQAMVRASLDDRPDLTDERKAEIISKYPEHERQMRRLGEPVFGAARVFPLSDLQVIEPPFDLPGWYKRISAIDFGYYHAAAFLWLAYDPEGDTGHIYDCAKVQRASIADQVHLMKKHGAEIRWVWPHDGLQDRGMGALAETFRKAGANMMPEHFQNPPLRDGSPGGFAVAPGIEEMRGRFATNRLKVFNHLSVWRDEYRLYHYDEKGKIVARDDDLMSATRQAVMSTRFAQVPLEYREPMAPLALGSGTAYDPFHDYSQDRPERR